MILDSFLEEVRPSDNFKKKAGELGFEPGFPASASHRRDTGMTLQNH
jgi:hypothetical protein